MLKKPEPRRTETVLLVDIVTPYEDWIDKTTEQKSARFVNDILKLDNFIGETESTEEESNTQWWPYTD